MSMQNTKRKSRLGYRLVTIKVLSSAPYAGRTEGMRNRPGSIYRKISYHIADIDISISYRIGNSDIGNFRYIVSVVISDIV
jgi:hypothetical protein